MHIQGHIVVTDQTIAQPVNWFSLSSRNTYIERKNKHIGKLIRNKTCTKKSVYETASLIKAHSFNSNKDISNFKKLSFCVSIIGQPTGKNVLSTSDKYHK